MEFELNAHQCAEVAEYMLDKYDRAMEPPVFSVISFRQWLKNVKNNNP